MSKSEIVETRTVFLGIPLEKPFPLGFGTLQYLPRVLYQVSALDRDKIVTGIGEASIDFPFTTYDSYDVYWALSQLELMGKEVGDREKILTDPGIRQKLLSDFPAAFTALNMAIDDLYGKVAGISVLDLYGQKRESGKALASISFQNETALLIAEISGKFEQGFIPKPKVGRGISEDLVTISAVSSFCTEKRIPFVLDFNAHYYPEEFEKLIRLLKVNGVDLYQLLFIEQPTIEEAGIDGLVFSRRVLTEINPSTIVMADESFVTMENAIECSRKGIALNFKLHKVGGLFYAREIEKAILKQNGQLSLGMVGGTFPTAIGRTYDQQGAATLETTSLPGDGWEPATDWFKGKKHLIKEEFPFDPYKKEFIPIRGMGIGVEPDWSKIEIHKIDYPKEEYHKIRSDQNGEHIHIELNPGQSYSSSYKKRTGRDPGWNL